MKPCTTIIWPKWATETRGLTKDTANMIVVDKQRICRAIVRGRVPDELVSQLVDLVVALQTLED